MAAGGAFVISLDFELMWGVRDKRTVRDYGSHIVGGRKAIPPLLAFFCERKIACTWATVGLLMCADRDEMIASFPALKPHYGDPALSPYEDLSDLGRDEDDDPYHYGMSLVRQIGATPLQEIGTHSFSHFYCLERGGGAQAFAADLAAARAVAQRRGFALSSIAFPRNQISAAHLAVCRDTGLTAYRGNERIWFHAARPDRENTALVRGFRLADNYLPIAGAQARRAEVEDGLVNVAASRFLRPAALAPIEPIRFTRIADAMSAAARDGGVFHLWWHPHNFGANPAANFAFLASICDHYAVLAGRYGMRSLTMSQVAAEALNGARGAAYQ